MNSFGKAVLIAIISGLCSGALVLGGVWALGLQQDKNADDGGFKRTTPGMDYLDKFTCPKTQNKIILINGKEDGYSREGDEPAKIRPRLLVSPFYQEMKSGINHGAGHRDYDERGYDKHLIDYFEVPAGIVSGELVFRARPFGSMRTDGIYLGDLEYAFTHDGIFERATYANAFSLLEKQGYNIERDELYKLDLITELFASATYKYPNKNVIDYMNGAAPRRVDLQIQDDTMVDFAALALCQKPVLAKGVSFAEHRYKSFGETISLLSCGFDRSVRGCDPHVGDTQCHIELPLACYHEGDAAPPPLLIKTGQGGAWVGGEVRLTNPVKGSRFKTISQVHDFCAAQFGGGWRTLDYHESGHGTITSQSRIPAGTRMWVDVKTTPATCWARDE